MPTYKVKGTDILHSKTIYPDGSTIELKKEDAERLADYVEFISDDPEIPADEVKKEEAKQEAKQEEVKQEEVKQTKPARSRKPQPKPATETPAEVKKEPEVKILPETPAPVAEVKTQTTTQVPPAAQKVIASAVEQVNKSIQGTTPQGGVNYQISPPTNMRSA